MKYIAVLCIIAAVASAKPARRQEEEGEPEKCCAPDQFSGSMGLIHADNEGGLYEVMAHISADFKKGVMGIYADVHGHTHHTVIDFNEGKMYNFGANGTSCHLTQADFPLFQCLPESAKLLGKYHLGADIPAASFKIDIPKLNSTTYLTLTKPCTPLTFVNLISIRGHEIMQAGNYLNLHEGIDDARIFDVPAECDSAVMEEATEEDVEY